MSDTNMTVWSERMIARALAIQTFQRRHLVVVPNCTWTGHECDLLVVTENLRLIDVEVKISRADLKADAKKEKWWHRELKGHTEFKDVIRHGRVIARFRDPIYESTRRAWPPKVWKHYYALPKEIWKPDLLDSLPSTSSGVILLTQRNGLVEPTVARRAAPNRDAKPVSSEDVIDIARLASLRMWESYLEVERMRPPPAEAA